MRIYNSSHPYYVLYFDVLLFRVGFNCSVETVGFFILQIVKLLKCSALLCQFVLLQ